MIAKPKILSPLDQALACQQKGDLEGAEAGFRAVLENDPDHPDAYQFIRGRTARLRERMAAELALAPGAPRVLGPRNGPIAGTYRVPVVLGLFSDSPDSIHYQLDTVQAAYFSDAPGTITDFYEEISGGRVELLGDVMDWTRSTFTRAEATGGESGLELHLFSNGGFSVSGSYTHSFGEIDSRAYSALAGLVFTFE